MDTSALLFLADRYPPDTFPAVWETLADLVGTGSVVASREVQRELEAKDDNGAYSWAQANRAMFRSPDSAQMSLAVDILNAPEFKDLVDIESEMPDACPFSAALAISNQAGQGNMLVSLPALVAMAPPAKRVTLSDVCQAYSDRVRFLTPYEMLQEVEVDVPEPGGRGLAGLYGIWSDLGITEENIEAAKLNLGSDRA